jgi:hypothetical protein
MIAGQLDTSKNRDFRSDGGAKDLIAAFGAWGPAFRAGLSVSLNGIPFSAPVSRYAGVRVSVSPGQRFW